MWTWRNNNESSHTNGQQGEITTLTALLMHARTYTHISDEQTPDKSRWASILNTGMCAHTHTHAHSHSQMDDHCGKNCTKCQAWKPGGQKCISSPCSPGQAIERCASPADNEEYLWGTRPSLVTSSYNSDAGMPRKNCWAYKKDKQKLC